MEFRTSLRGGRQKRYFGLVGDRQACSVDRETTATKLSDYWAKTVNTLKLLCGCILLQLCIVTDCTAQQRSDRYNVLFIISDDLTYTALSCYGNSDCETPNIDAIAARGTRYTRAYCQGTYCGPSRASFMSGYYPHATGVLGYKNPRLQIGDRETW